MRRETRLPLRIFFALSMLVLGSPLAAEPVRSQRIGGLKAEIAALIVSGQEGGEIDLVAAAEAGRQPEEGEFPISIWIEARGGSILPPESLGRIEIYVYALDEANGVVDSLLETVAIAGENEANLLRATGMRFSGELYAPPGVYSLRVLLREVASGRMGARTLTVDVADRASPTPRLLAPRIAAPPGDWFSIEPASGPAPEAGRATRPVVPVDTEVEITVPLLGGAAISTERLELVVSGTTFAASLVARRSGTDGDAETLAIRFDTAALAAGIHEIVARIPGAGVASPPLTFIVAAVDEPTSWVALNPAGEPTAPTATPQIAERTRRQRRVRLDLESEGAAYRRALAALGDETLAHPDQAADRLLREFERRILGDHGADVLPELERVEARVAQELSARTPAALAPIIALHSRAYSHYFERREFLLSTFSRRALVRLGNLYLRLVGDRPAKTHGADVFTSLGAELQLRDHGRLALEMFKRSLETDPTNRAAQVGLATIYERGEAYEDAIYAFKQILDDDPDNWEARLRLAICELRIDRRTAGRRNLERVISAERAEPWVRTIAYQELARWHLEREEHLEVAQTIREAIDALPFDAQIHVLLAYAEDAMGDPWAARETLDRKPGDAGSVAQQLGDSPRRFYAVRENQHVAETAQRLLAWDVENRPVLQRALESVGKESKR